MFKKIHWNSITLQRLFCTKFSLQKNRARMHMYFRVSFRFDGKIAEKLQIALRIS